LCSARLGWFSFLGRLEQQEDIPYNIMINFIDRCYGHTARKAGVPIALLPVFTTEIEVECYKGCTKRMGLYHFTEARKEPRTICSSKVASRYNYFNTLFTICYLPKLIVG